MYIDRTASKCIACKREFEHNSNVVIAGNYNKFNRDIPDILVFGTYCSPCFLLAAGMANAKLDRA